MLNSHVGSRRPATVCVSLINPTSCALRLLCFWSHLGNYLIAPGSSYILAKYLMLTIQLVCISHWSWLNYFLAKWLRARTWTDYELLMFTSCQNLAGGESEESYERWRERKMVSTCIQVNITLWLTHWCRYCYVCWKHGLGLFRFDSWLSCRSVSVCSKYCTRCSICYCCT